MKQDQKTGAGQVVLKLRQIEVQTAQFKSLAIACREAEISEQSDSRWRKKYGGLQIDQDRRMKDLKRENARLRQLVSDLFLEKQVLVDVARQSTAFVRSMVSQNAMPAGSSASTGARNATCRRCRLTRMR